jgi:hypothetical protein
MPDNFSPRKANLTSHRAPASVWDKSGWDGTPERLALTRLLVGIGGGALALQALRQRSWGGGVLAGIGGTLAWWALTGEGDLSEARCWFERVMQRAPWNREDAVHEASDASFPASDAPSFTPTTGASVRGPAASTY